MAAQKTFRVRERRNSDGSTTYYARFTDQHGRRREFPLGRTPDFTAKLAAREMEHIKADVERGVWAPHTARREDPKTLLFRDMAYDWWDNKVAERKAENTQRAYKAELEGHLVPFFGDMRVASITKHDVDRFVQGGVKRGMKASY